MRYSGRGVARRGLVHRRWLRALSLQVALGLYAQCAHYGCFLEVLFKKYLRKILILGTNEWKIRKKNKGSILCQFKSWHNKSSLFFLICFLLVHKILVRILETFWTKNLKSSHSGALHLEEKILYYSVLVWLWTCWVHKGPEGASRTRRSGRIKYPYCHRVSLQYYSSVSNRISLAEFFSDRISLAAYGGAWFECECCHSKVPF